MADNYTPLSFTAGRTPNVAKVDPRLVEIVSGAAAGLPPGYVVTINEGYNPSGHTAYSQHHIAGKGALDVQITDPSGKVITNRGADTTGLYAQLASNAYGYMLQNYPELKGLLAWGGSFGVTDGSNVRDLMHFDIGGERGNLGPHLAQLGASPATYGLKDPQSILASLGFADNGKVGPDQVKQFQAAAGLTPDGIVGPQTLAALAQTQQSELAASRFAPPEALAYDPGALALPAGAAAAAVAASVPPDAGQAALAFAEAQPVNSPGLAAVTDLAARSPVPPTSVLPVPADATAAIPPTSVAGEDLSAPRTTGYPTTAIAPSTGIAPRAGPFFDWSALQQSPPAAVSRYPSDVQMPQPLGAVQMALPTARPTLTSPVGLPSAGTPTAAPVGADEAYSSHQPAPVMPGMQPIKAGPWGADAILKAYVANDPKAVQAAPGIIRDAASNDKLGIFSKYGFGAEAGVKKAIDGYLEGAVMADPVLGQTISTNIAANPALNAGVPKAEQTKMAAVLGRVPAVSSIGSIPLPTPRPEPASVFTDRSLASGPFFNWSQIQAPFSDTRSYAEPAKSSSPSLAATATVAAGAPKYGGGGWSPSAPVYSGFTPSFSSSGGDTASASKSYNAGTPVQSSYDVRSSADAGYAAVPASRAATTQPANPWAAMAAAGPPAPAPVAPAASAYDAAPFSASDIAASLSPSMTFEPQAAPAAARPAAVRSMAPVRSQIARTVMPVMRAPSVSGRYVSNPAPAALVQSQKLAAALGSINAARNAGYTTTPGSRLEGLAAQGYSMPNYSSGSGGAVYAYHPDGQGGGTYVNSYGTTMSY